MYNETFFYPDYLQHYGVKGMKWGVRRKQIRDARADRNIKQISTHSTANKMMLDAKNKAAEAKYIGGRTAVRDNFINRALDKYDAKTLEKTKARNKVDYDIAELSDKFSIARQKAKKDKTYKKSSEYKNARKNYGRACLERYMLGDEAYAEIHTNVNMGKSERAARGEYVTKMVAGQLVRALI